MVLPHAAAGVEHWPVWYMCTCAVNYGELRGITGLIAMDDVLQLL